jgi:hypothetical protein
MKRQALHLFSILTIVSFLFIAFGSDDDNGSSSSSTDTNKFLAYSYAEDFVKQKLKSPSTAEFPGTFEKDKHITELGNSQYQITSWVDSQNGFGAMLRSKFSCKIIFEGDNVRCENLVIE